MTIYKKGLFIGRFQPFHKGHLFLINHVRKKAQKLVIGIGSANVFDEDNPFTYEERKRMIETVIKKEKLDSFVEKIVPLNDYYDDELWFKNTLLKTGKIDPARGGVDLVVGNNEWVNGIFEKRGYTILRVGYYKRYLYEGEKIRKLLKYTYSRRPSSIGKQEWTKRVPRYLVAMIKKSYTLHVIRYKFNHIALGGTFDHFHKGHEALIDTALKYGNHLSIGISTSKIYKDKDSLNTIESFNERKKSVTEYLIKKKSLKRTTFFPLSDIYGTTKSDGTIEAIVVSRSTYPNGIKINRLRSERRLPELKIICIKDVKGDDGQLISSERIRKGGIDREGNVYESRIMNNELRIKKQLILPEYFREELRKPLGKVILGKENELEKTAKKVLQSIKRLKYPIVIAVGDIIANSLERVGFIPDIKIIDYRSRRKDLSDSATQFLSRESLPAKTRALESEKIAFASSGYINYPGTITVKTVLALKKTIQKAIFKKQTLIINGEEDLLALPAILLAPLGSIVLYGQMDLGVVMVEVDEKMKKEIERILKKFT